MPKGIKNEHELNMFGNLLKNLDLHPSAREAFTKEAAHSQEAEVAEEISKWNLWKEEVVEKAKFHYGDADWEERMAAVVLLYELRK